MSQITTGLRAILSSPTVYSLFQYLMGAHRAWILFVKNDVRPKPGDNILDIGCGPADILSYLPDVNYWGFDISKVYIDKARAKYGSHGNFHCGILTLAGLDSLPKFDIVVASGVLHHLDDDVAKEFLALAHAALRPGGRLVTVDPCFAPGQNFIARFLISQDRGQCVRDRAGYDGLAENIFETRHVEVRHKAWIPYTHCYIEGTRT